jgi:site-specific recombinase XerD
VLGDWRRRLIDRGLAPSTVNLALAAATSLLDSRALPAPRVPRVEVDPSAPRAFSREQLRAVQREADRLPSSRDRAIMEVLLRTGLRIGEVAALDAADVRLTQRTGEQLSVRSLTKLVGQVMAAAGVEESAHALRHTIATRLMREHGDDLALVADVLGDTDVKTTRRYARSELEARRKALEALDR